MLKTNAFFVFINTCLYLSFNISETVAQDGSIAWILANVGQRFYYRVNYDADNWNNIFIQLQTDHTVSRPDIVFMTLVLVNAYTND